MQYRELGQSGITASAVGLGTWAIGGWMWGGVDDAEAVESIQAAYDAGIDLIDTAPAYGFGKSEELVGEAIAEFRDKVVLATKCGLVWDTDKGEYFFTTDRDDMSDTGDIKVHRLLAPDSIRRELEASLKRLNTDYIDLYQTHWQDATTPIEDTMACLMKLRDEGKIRAIGVCNASIEQIDRYSAVAALDTDQERYSLLDRKLEQAHLPHLLKKQIAFLAYSPMEKGLLTGKVGPDREFAPGDQRLRDERFSVDNRKRVLAMLDEFQPIAEAQGITLAQLVIAWTIAQPGVTHALVGARHARQARENAAAGEVSLSDEQVAQMNKAIARHAEAIV